MSNDVLKTLKHLEAMVELLVDGVNIRKWYSTSEFARIVGKAEYTVREWCRQGRINAEKRESGRGPFAAWVIAQQELLRVQREGLLPLRRRA